MTLTFVEPATGVAPLNILLYGPPGTGKTVGACSAPGPVLVVNAEGPGALLNARKRFGNDSVREVRFEGRRTLEDLHVFLSKRDNDIRTVVIDTLGEVYRGLLEELGGKRPTLQNYGDANLTIERSIRALRDLPVNLVLVAHEQLDQNGETGEILCRPLTGGKKLPEQIMAQMDICAYTGIVMTDGEDGKETKFVGQLVEGRGRRCKDRSGVLGVTRELDLSEWIETASAEILVDAPSEDRPSDVPAPTLVDPAERTPVSVATKSQRNKVRYEADKKGLTAGDFANVMRNAAGVVSKEHESVDDAKADAEALLERLPWRLVDAVLKSIEDWEEVPFS